MIFTEKSISILFDLLRSPIVCSPSDSMKEVLEVLQKNNIGSLVIVEDGQVKGIFTERDFLLKVANKNYLENLNKPVKDFMTANPKAIKENEKISLALKTMRLGKFRHLVVVNEDGKLEKVLSIKDLLDFIVDEVEV